MKFHLDEHVGPAVAHGLRGRGIDVSTTQESELIGSSDERQLAFAHAEGRVPVTNDPDFLRLHQRGESHSGIAFYADQERPVGALIRQLELMHRVVSSESMRGRIEFLSMGF